MKGETKIVGFFGEPCHDLVIYLSQLIYHLGYNVLICDNTQTQVVKNCISKPINQKGIIHFKHIDFLSMKDMELGSKIDEMKQVSQRKEKLEQNKKKQIEYNILQNIGQNMDQQTEAKWLENTYSIVFIVNDIDKINLPINLARYDERFIITSLTKKSIEDTAASIHAMQEPCQIIYRDVFPCKLNPEYIYTAYFYNNELLTMKYEIDFDEYDYEYRIRMEYESQSGFQYLSKSYENCLKEMSNLFFTTYEKEMEKAFKKAKRGMKRYV